jgi:glycosyltransferase involved in cell wall biosynthesis
MKRVMLTTYPSAFLHHGGGEREISLLRDALNDSGVIVDIYGSNSNEISSYDFVIHSSLVASSEHLILPIAEAGVRLISWPNLWFASPPTREHLANLKRLLAHFEAFIFRSKAEEFHFREFFDLEGKIVLQSSCLVSPKFLRRDVSPVFRESYGLNRYAIWPGIIEPQKNQLAAVRAFRDMDIDLIISGRVRDREYLTLCKQEAGSNVRFIPPMPFGSELHLSALMYSELFIELPFDFPGTSALEAAVAGSKLLLTRCSWTEEMLGGICEQVVPDDVTAIQSAIDKVISNPELKKPIFEYISMENSVKSLRDYILG